MQGQRLALEHGTMDLGAVRLHYVRKGSGPLLLLLHGFPDFWYGWRHQLDELAKDNEVIALDMRGYNDSDKPKGRDAYRMQVLVEDVARAIHHLGHKKAVVAGHDWGGAVAWAFAYAHPEALDGLIIINAPHPAIFARAIRTWKQFRRSWYMLLFQLPVLPEWLLTRDDGALMEAVYRPSSGQKSAMTDDDIRAYRAAVQRPGAATAMLNYYRNLLRSTGSARGLGRVKAPTLVLWGMDDVALGQELTDGLERYVADLTLERVPHAGHFVHQERPEIVNVHMRRFLDGLGRRATRRPATRRPAKRSSGPPTSER